jgi:hypothetical protein
MSTAAKTSSLRSSQPYEAGTMSTPTPAATLSHAVLMLVGRKNARYSSTEDSDPHVSFSLIQQKYLHTTHM